jgi:hypothetical protein
MPKINSYVRNLSRVRTKVTAVRRRKVFQGKPAEEHLNESHARELVARKLVLPHVKNAFGNNLRAVIIPGSVQLGIRKSTRKTETSDLDLKIVINTKFINQVGPQILERFRVTLEQMCKRAGVTTNIYLAYSHGFKNRRTLHWKTPFQVIYGKAWIQEKLGADFLDTFGEKRKHLLETRHANR